MYMRKIAAAAGFATGAALAFAPFASADVTEITTTVSSEITSMNSLFDFEALLAGKLADVIPASATNPFDTIPLADAPLSGTSPLDYELYGVDPLAAGPVTDPGSYEVFNGALGKFDDAYNVMLYASLNNGAIDPNDADFIGSASSIDHAQGLATATDAYDYFYNFAIGDLSGYFHTDLSAFDIVAAPGAADAAAGASGLATTVSSEITSLNSMFVADANLFGVQADLVAPTASNPFETISLAGAPDTAPFNAFDSFLYGLNPAANSVGDPGAYELFNGALVRFDDALNIGLYALENNGALLPAADFATDLFGSTSGLTTELAGLTASQAITELLGNGLSDLAGYFDPSALIP